jgi:hypothetical protein
MGLIGDGERRFQYLDAGCIRERHCYAGARWFMCVSAHDRRLGSQSHGLRRLAPFGKATKLAIPPPLLAEQVLANSQQVQTTEYLDYGSSRLAVSKSNGCYPCIDSSPTWGYLACRQSSQTTVRNRKERSSWLSESLLINTSFKSPGNPGHSVQRSNIFAAPLTV